MIPHFIKWFLFIFFSCSTILLSGQKNILDFYIKKGLKDNLQLQKNELAIKKQQFKTTAAKGNRLPMVTFEPSYLLAAGGRRLEFPVGDLFNPTYQALNELTQSNSFPTDLKNIDEQLTPSNFYDTRFYVSYPLFNPTIYYNLKAQEQLITVEQAKMDSYKVELTKEIKVAYYNYFKTFEVLSIFEESEKLLNQLLRFNQKLVRYNKATEEILTGVTFELAKINSDRANIIQQQAIAKAYFNSLLNRDLDSPIKKEEKNVESSIINQKLEKLRNQALQNRSELNQIQNAIKATQIVTEINEKSLLPTVGLQGSIGFQGNGFKYKKEEALATFAIGAKWIIYDGKKRRQKIEQSKIETAELQKDYEMVQQQIELQVVNAWHGLNAATEKLKSEQVALRSAQKNFTIIRKKYENQKAILIEFLDARTKFTNAQISYSIAQYDVLIRQAELERAVSY